MTMTNQTKDVLKVMVLSTLTALMLALAIGLSTYVVLKAVPQKPHAVEGREQWINARDGTNWPEADDSFARHRLMD